MTRNRITRRSLKRKIIGVASALFMAVALIASGFSAWIISTNASIEANLGVSVATVSKSVMTISVDGLDKEGKLDQSLSFKPDENDTSGRVRYSDSVDGGGCESLTILLTGKITNAQHLGTLSITLDYSQTKLKQAADAGYITLPAIQEVITLSNLNDGKAPTDGDYITSLDGVQFGYIVIADTDEFGNPVTDEAGERTYTAYFVYTATFGWGEKFAYVNPGYYYDGVDGKGGILSDSIVSFVNAKSAVDIENELNAFNNSLKDENGKLGSLKITIDANVK